MKVLLAHNFYKESGGEDVVFEAEAGMLEAAGHSVSRYTLDNSNITGVLSQTRATLSVLGTKRRSADLARVIEDFKPDIIHVHNYFPQLTPAVFVAAIRSQVPIVQTLHNYRPVCAAATLSYNGSACEACVGHSHIKGIERRCYKSSYIGSAAVTLVGSNMKRIYNRSPDWISLIALTEFAKKIFVKDGFDESRIFVKGNSVAQVDVIHPSVRERKITFVGRLSQEKGVAMLPEMAALVNGKIEVIGSGASYDDIFRRRPPNLLLLGTLGKSEILERLRSSAALIVPSQWYEGFPMVILEAFATGTPVIASNFGALPEIINNDLNGFLVERGDVNAWASACNLLLDNSEYARALGHRALQTFRMKFSPEQNLNALLRIYEGAITRALAK